MILSENIKSIKGIGEKTAALFAKLGVNTVEQLLRFYPRTYRNYPEIRKLSSECVGEKSAVLLRINENINFRKGKRVSVGTVKCSDGNNLLLAVFFNCDYLKSVLKAGNYYVFYGTLLLENNFFKFEMPEIYKQDEYQILTQSFLPVYSLTKGLSNKTVIKAVKSVIEDGLLSFFEEYLPHTILNDYNLISRKEAIKGIHFPQNISDFENSRKRLSFDELFMFIVMIRRSKSNAVNVESLYSMIETAGPKRLIEQLPYKLTDAQIRVYNEIVSDMTSGFVMNRLVQGDVGSGKTIVAFLSVLLCVENGHQAAIMAPTQLLAVQHYNNLKELASKYNLPLNISLLTGAVKKSQKKDEYESVKSGEANVVIGTHALIQEELEFKNLGLVITDEQHRFGVMQRKSFGNKGGNPHVLVMSATPIPRTLSIIMYGDMHLSVIDEKPSSRLPIKNCVVNTSYRPKAYSFIENQIKNGFQAYIICPMVEANDSLEDVENVSEYTMKLRKALPNINIECIHGRMKPTLKEEIMNNFSDGKIDVLVSTTVIEVGIDVPNATVIMVENAERFGLSQLHQLRGRIGRGSSQSYSIFVNGSQDSKHNERLDVLNRTNDGFVVAKEDLRLRGSGDIFGIRQSGNMNFEIADLYRDSEMIIEISKIVDEILEKDPDLSKTENLGIKTYVLENENKFIDFGSI